MDSTTTIQRLQVIKPANMTFAEMDLRYGPPPSSSYDLCVQLRAEINMNKRNLIDAAALQQLFRYSTIGA